MSVDRKSNYRPDIDGLRAIAILSVLAYHAFPRNFKGGFVGVDVFFVISGYLISNILFASLAANNFSFKEFYIHRVRRIFPALILVLISCLAAGWWLLLPMEYQSLGKHEMASAAFFENYALWNESGYFDVSSELKPLNHLWSLAIEEQFYLVFPLVIWVAWKMQWKFWWVITAFFLLSFISNIQTSDSAALYFSPQTRGWELMSGALLSCIAQSEWRAKWSQSTREIAALVGIIAVMASVKLVSEKGFPGFQAIVPVTGALLVLGAGPVTRVSSFLSSRIFVFIGLISYPLYLWHWPLLAFARITNIGDPTPGIRLALVVVSFVLAYLTYKYIERPVRFNPNAASKNLIAIAAIVGIGLAGFIVSNDGISVHSTEKNLGSDAAKKVQDLANAARFFDYDVPKSLHTDTRTGLKAMGSPDASEWVLFVGDSHAGQYQNAIQMLYDNTLIESKVGILFDNSGFPPKINLKLLQERKITTVVLSYFWALRFGSATVDQSMRYRGNDKNGDPVLVSKPERMLAEAENIQTYVAELRKRKIQVWIVLDNPFGKELDAYSNVKRSLMGGVQVRLPEVLLRKDGAERTEPIRSYLLNIVDETKSKVIDPFEFLCDSRTCPLFEASGKPLYRDYDHLSSYALLNKAGFLGAVFLDGDKGR